MRRQNDWLKPGPTSQYLPLKVRHSSYHSPFCELISEIVLTTADHAVGWSRTQATIGQGTCLAEETGGSHVWIWWPISGFPQPTASASCRRSQPSGHRAPCSGAPCNIACPACTLLHSFCPWEVAHDAHQSLQPRQSVLMLVSQLTHL